MGERWKDDPFEYRAKRIADAQRELAPALESSGRTPEQRAAHSRARARETDRLARAGLRAAIDAHYEMIQEQAAIIAKLEARIDELGEMFEQVAQGNRHLAGRIDEEVTRRVAANVEQERRIDENRALVLAQHHDDKLFRARVIEAVPSVGKPTLREQCDAAWRAPTKE